MRVRTGLALLALAAGPLIPVPAAAADPVVVSIGDGRVWEGNQGTRTAKLTVSLSGPSTSTVTVAYTTTDAGATSPADYTATSGTVSFAPGEVTRTVPVTVNGDVADESDERVTVTLAALAGAAPGDASAFVEIVDDEPSTGQNIAIGDAYVHEGDAVKRRAKLNVSLAKPLAETVTIAWATGTLDETSGTVWATGGVDFVDTTGTVTIAAGRTATTIVVKVKPDLVAEPDLEQFVVQLFDASTGTFRDATGQVFIVDDE